MNINTKAVTLRGLWRRFRADEHGLVTVEWVALAGAVVIGGITVAWLVLNGVQAQAKTTGSTLTACEIYAAKHTGSTSGCT